MGNARSEVARLGYKIYQAVTPRPTRQQVNAALADRELEPISDRTFRHYRVMDRNGQDEYLPINEWDIRRKRGPNLN